MDKCTVDLTAVRVGDALAWIGDDGWYRRQSASVGVVVKLTPTQIVVRSGERRVEYRFRRATGSMVGSQFTYLHDQNEPEILALRSVMRARTALADIETTIGAARIKDPTDAVQVLGKVRVLVEAALLDIQQREVKPE